MKLKNSFFYTIRENIKDEDSKSGNLLVRSGMIKKISNGIYMYMPMGIKVLKNIEKVVREEMDKAGAQELLMPNLLPEDVYVNSGRRDIFGSNMFSLKDRYERDYVLGPTHEEFFVEAAKMKIKSYKDLPFNLYQIGNKYRDETRPRYGLIRVREFFMKDAYSFDANLEGLDISYDKMFNAYKKIFDRLEIDYKIVKADTGAMGGILSEEFQAVTDIGEDVLVLCDSCNFASNIEVSECSINEKQTKESLMPYELKHTPNVGTIEDVANYLELSNDKFVKTLIYKGDNNFYACLVQGNREINELKLKNLLDVKDLSLASLEEVEKITNAKVGFAGPINLETSIIADSDVTYMSNFIVGANKTDYHFINANISDFKISKIGDIKNILEGDTCPKCGGKIYFKKGIEIGNTFKLGNKYAKSLDLTYLDQNNKLCYPEMGCYGIGLGRIMAALAEQKGDEKGLNFPVSVAPFKVGIVLIGEDSKQVETANMIYDDLNKKGISVLLDDRDERAGVKFNDMDLIGIPIRVTVGKKVADGLVELKSYNSEVKDINIDNVIEEILKKI